MNISLSGFGDLVGDARVVALGESAHHVREYDLVRHQLLQFLVEEKGFTALLMESGFSEGLALTAWDGSGPFPEGAMTYRFGRNPEMQHLLGWARRHGVAFYGLDLPGDLASMSPALDHLANFDNIDGVRRHADKFASAYTMPALAAYRAMPQEDRDALTVALAELSARFAVRHRGAAEARHELRLLVLLDQMLRADPSLNVRDAAMAETVDWVRGQGHRKIVVAAANTHIQRVFPGLDVLGSHLAAAFGDDYLAVGLTAHGGVTPTRRPAPDAPAGAETVAVPLPAPVPGSVEDFLGPRPVVADLRPLRGRRGPDRVRLLDTWLEGPVAEAYDLIVNLPEISPTPEGVWNGGRRHP